VSEPAAIAVVGRGPAGLAAAILLADLGYAVTLIGPKAPPDERTAALLAGSVALLDRLRIWPKVAAGAAPLRKLRIVDGTERLFRAPEVIFESSEIDLDAFGYNLGNATLTAALEDAATERGIARVDGFADGARSAGDGVAVATASGPVEANLVVAADGRQSRMRSAAGIAIDDWRYEQSALVCNLRHSEPHHDTSTEFHTEAGPFTLVPLPGNRSSLVLVARPAEIDRLKALDDASLAGELETRSQSILGTIAIDGRRGVFPISGMRARSLAANRTVLVGEAAHVLPPIGAQGLNLGFRDVAALGEVLAGPREDPGADRVLADYQAARETDVLVRGSAVDALNRTLLSEFLPVQALRSLGLALVGNIPLLRRFAMRRGVGV
jgi:2-octaprenyl-6-methoxyphenol hydroxylase